jgi:hypothetical protein
MTYRNTVDDKFKTYENHKNTYIHKQDLKVRDDGILIKLLTFWTLSTVMFLRKTTFRRLDSTSVLR